MASWSYYEPLGGSGNFPSSPFGSGFAEPITSNKPQPPAQQPQLSTPSAPPMTAHQAPAPPKVYPEETKQVQVPQAPARKTGWEDISDYYQNGDWLFIGIAVLIVDVIVLMLIRFFPDIFGKAINVWYNRFKLSAVMADVFIIMIGFGIARYIYTEYIYPNYDWNPTYFTGLTVVVQVIHDILFYFGIIKTVPEGRNAMIDVFKQYADSGGAKVVGADSAMMVGSSVLSMLLKAAPGHIVAFVGILTAYALPYLLEVRNEFSGVA